MSFSSCPRRIPYRVLIEKEGVQAQRIRSPYS